MTSSIVTVLGLCYPLFVLFGLRYLPPAALVGVPGVLLTVRLVLGNRGASELVLSGTFLISLGLLALSPLLAVRMYPVLVSLGFAALFIQTLWQPPVMIERFARLAEPNLPDAARPYLRRVTFAWIIFFLANATIAAWTVAYGTAGQWTLYNGLISYLLIGAMFGGEYLIRCWVRP